MKFLATLLSAFAVFHVNAQSNRPLGSWDDFLPYKNARMVAQSPDKIFCATAASMYFVQKSDLYMERMSKCNGLSDIGFRAIEYDAPRQQVIVAYENSNIDLWSESGVANIPDIKLKNIVGDKTIYHVYPDGDRAYLSMGFGIVVLDLEKREVKDTYYIGTNGTDLKVNAVTTAFGRVFAATADGLYTADAASPALNNFNVWLRLDTASALPHSAAHQVYHDGTRVFAVYHDSLFAYDGAAWTLIYSHPGFTLNHVKRFNAELYVSEINLSTGAAQITLLDASTNAVVNTMPGGEFIGNPMDVEVDETGRMWLADLFRGLSHSKNNAWSFIYPDGPGSANVWQIDAYRGNAYVAPGGLTTSGGFSFNEDGFFVFENNEWKTYSRYNHPAFSDSIKDIIGVSHNALTGKTYFTSFIEGGILEYENNAFTIYKQGIVSVDPAFYNHPTFDAVTDGNGNTWFSNPTTTKPLIVRTPDGQWKAFGFTGLPGTVGFTRLYADYNNRIWIVLKNEGLVVYDPGADVLSAADDDFRRLTATDGQGSLPSNTVLDVAMDLNGEVWIGTDKGIAVMYCAGSVMDGCEAQKIIVSGTDSIAGYLLETERVSTVTIDPGNRKWIGTDNGVWLLSENGLEEAQHFTVDNSPLFANTITDIAVDGSTGLVFIGTSKGMLGYQSNAIDARGGEKRCEASVFPNPVKHDYSGPIAIQNVPYNGTVKITDAAGMLVYQTTANGGMAAWNGFDYNGRRASSGVYYVTAVAQDGASTCRAKFVLLH